MAYDNHYRRHYRRIELDIAGDLTCRCSDCGSGNTTGDIVYQCTLPYTATTYCKTCYRKKLLAEQL